MCGQVRRVPRPYKQNLGVGGEYRAVMPSWGAPNAGGLYLILMILVIKGRRALSIWLGDANCYNRSTICPPTLKGPCMSEDRDAQFCTEIRDRILDSTSSFAYSSSDL